MKHSKVQLLSFYYRFLKPENNENWRVIVVVMPEFLTSTAYPELLENIIQKAQEQNAPELRFLTHPKELELHKALKNHNILPTYCSYSLCLEDLQRVPKREIPNGIKVIVTTDLEHDKTQFVAVGNAAYKDRPNFIADTEESLTKIFAQYGKIYNIEHHLAYEGKTMVGVCSVYNDPRENTNRMVEVYVDPEHRHNGIGSALLTHGIDNLKMSDSALVKLNTVDVNPEYLKFAQKFGFKELKDQTLTHSFVTLDKL